MQDCGYQRSEDIKTKIDSLLWRRDSHHIFDGYWRIWPGQCNIKIVQVLSSTSQCNIKIVVLSSTSHVYYVNCFRYCLRMKQNKLRESIALFENIISYPWFQEAAIILLLNNTDLFHEKIVRSNLAIHFPAYKGWSSLQNYYGFTVISPHFTTLYRSTWWSRDSKAVFATAVS